MVGKFQLAKRWVAYAHSGRYSNPAVLFVHGLGGSYRMTQELLFPFFEKEFFCLAPSLPGFGGSEPFSRGRHTMARYAEFLKKFLYAFGIREAHVIGFSAGGAPSLLFAAQNPELARTLCLQGIPYRGQDFPLWPRSLFGVASSVASAVPLGIGTYFLMRTARKIESCYTARVSHEPVPTHIEAQDLKGTTPRAWVESVVDLMKQDLTNEARSLAVPTLLIDGAESRWYPIATTERLAALFPGSTHQLVSGYGHLFPFVAPRIFSEIVLPFLKQH